MANEQGFVTTFSAGFCSSSCFVLPPHKIDDVSKVENIARSPRARMVPNSFGREGDATFIEYRVGHEFQSEIRRIYFPSEYGVTAFDTPDGAGRNFEMAFMNGELSGGFPIFLMKSRAYLPILDHEVIYIG
ncbi:hypothetical protein NFO65_15065 [Neorhizobium galegae]|uniref:hypothetical protein n=1 Tax=Neorhizobium galegae TaxID=399 RepID=UPI002100F0CE|nr:hypothetical protein [Neorhizobium galegae]MCQ1572051.1 hypothetical protein [Neorhizobium galegae]